MARGTESGEKKFDTDQKNHEDEITHKQALEEEERKEAAKNKKMVAESTSKLVSCLEKLAGNPSNNDDEKMQKMQDQIDDKFATLDNKLGSLDAKFDSLLAVMQQIVERKKISLINFY